MCVMCAEGGRGGVCVCHAALNTCVVWVSRGACNHFQNRCNVVGADHPVVVDEASTLPSGVTPGDF